MLLVSDLDGTMVGPGADFDAATRRFRVYWENNAQLAGSVLCYNTGRSIGQVVSLLEEKQGALAVPDVVITAVGARPPALARRHAAPATHGRAGEACSPAACRHQGVPPGRGC